MGVTESANHNRIEAGSHPISDLYPFRGLRGLSWRENLDQQPARINGTAGYQRAGSAVDALEQTLDGLQQIGIRSVNFLVIVAENDMPAEQRSDSLLASSLPQVADVVEELAAEMDVRFIWQPPVQRDPALSVPEQVHLGPRCTADVSIRVESDGDVIPPRGPHVVAGNLLRDAWVEIWANPAFVRYRERVERPTHCEECPGLTICAADCPREPAGWALNA